MLRGWCLALEQGDELEGIFGGTTTRERREMRRARGQNGGVKDHVPDSLRRGQVGLYEALVRARVSLTDRDLDHFFTATTEAAMWAVSLDDFFKELHQGEHLKHRGSDRGAKLLVGIRWARNQGVHNLVGVYRTTPEEQSGISGTFSEPFYGERFGARWMRRSEVTVKLRDGHPESEKVYDKMLAGHDVCDTLDSAADFLWMRAGPEVPSDPPPLA